MKKIFFIAVALVAFATASFAQGCVYDRQTGVIKIWKPDPIIVDGDFSVSASKQVRFSKGNLQYTKSTGKWKIMSHQYDVVETLSQNVGNDYASQNVITLFGWATSGWRDPDDATAVHYLPYTTCNTNHGTAGNNYQYGPSTTKVADEQSWSKSASYKRYDWGVNNSSDLGTGWRTLTIQEWEYLLTSRTNALTLRTLATVNGIHGLILMPDGWTADGVSLTITTSSYDTNNINLTNWGTLEDQGCVFLPAAGYRDGVSVSYTGSWGCYWSSSNCSASNAYRMRFDASGMSPRGNFTRQRGCSVRLVKDVE